MNPAVKVGEHREEILALAQEHVAARVRLFGSVARGDARETSGVDLLVFEPGTSLLDHAALLDDLERLLETRVDVIREKALRPELRDEIVREAVAF